jgi:hypothetical protein
LRLSGINRRRTDHYVQEWIYGLVHASEEGVPQGSILSPLALHTTAYSKDAWLFIRSLKTTPDKFFSNYVFGLKLIFFGTRFEKTISVETFWLHDVTMSIVVFSVPERGDYECVFNSSKSSICDGFACHSLAFSGLSQAS